MNATEIEIPREVDAALGRLARVRRMPKPVLRLAVFDGLRMLAFEAGVPQVAPPRFSTVTDAAGLSGPSALFCAMVLAHAVRAGVPVSRGRRSP